MMTDSEKVIVIVISFRTSHLISNLLSSFDEARLDLRFLVLDNGSTAETFSELQCIEDPRMELLRSEENLGFTGGINFTLRYALANSGSFNYFVLFNPDALSEPGLIWNLKECMDAYPKAACISPRIYHLDGTPWYSGALINPRNGTVDNNPSVHMTLDPKGCYEVDVFSGCAGLFRLDRVLEAGMFNEDLFMYYDEVEMSIRLRKLGYKIMYRPVLKVMHDVSYTTRKISHLKSYYMSRNKFAVFGGSMNYVYKVHFILYELAFHLKNLRFKNALYHIKGFIDYKRGRYGSLSGK